MRIKVLLVTAFSAAFASGAVSALDFGQKVEQQLKGSSLSLFGLLGTLNASSTTQTTAADAEADPTKLVTLAPGLSAKVVSKDINLGGNIDQMVLLPNDSNPTTIIACNEEGPGSTPNLVPSVQRIDIATGNVATVLTGLNRCDPVRKTAWGTVIVAEENGTASRIVEILDPMTTDNINISGTTSSDATKAVVRTAMGALSFEGISLLPNGVMYYGAEDRPGSSVTGSTATLGNGGGSYFKFIPTTPWVPGSPAITDLANSPLTGGRIFGLRIGRNGGSTDVGQGNEFGRGSWVEVVDASVVNGVTISRANLRQAANALKLTAYYRPEDMDVDPKALNSGNVRVCGTNTGQDVPVTGATPANADNHWGEVYCITDGTVSAAAVINTGTQNTGGATYTLNNGAGTTVPEYQPLVIGNRDFAMMDNIAFQPGRGNIVLHEDGEGFTDSPSRGNDLWDCLDDGADKDILSDGCVKVGTINDLIGNGSIASPNGAEWTGGIFDASGTRFFVSIQHSITNGTSGTPGPTYQHGYLLEIDGWQ